MRWITPEGFPFVGNDTAKAQLAARLSDGAFPHAMLLEGPAGSGRRTMARMLAAAALCRGDGERPCGTCPVCRKVFAGSHPDVTQLGGDGEARSFHLDTVRSLREDAYVLPNEGARRVFILCDIQNMTEQAQNALLKILEEPPAHVLFLLTCEQRSQLLETVLSRVFPVTLRGVDTAEAVTALRRYLPDRSPEELQQSAVLWGGVIGQALRGLRDGSYRELLTLLTQLAQGVVAGSELTLLKATAPLEKNREAVPAVLSGLQLIFRDALTARFGGTAFLGTDPETARMLGQTLAQHQLLELLRVVEDLQIARLYNMNHTLFLTTLCARLRRAVGR